MSHIPFAERAETPWNEQNAERIMPLCGIERQVRTRLTPPPLAHA